MADIVIIDIETSGLDAEREQIIELAAVKVRRGLIVDSFSSLVACERCLSEEIVALTGISEEMLIGQPAVEEVIARLEQFVGDAAIGAHNAGFDRGFVQRAWADQRPWLDTITLAQIVYPCSSSYSLAWLCDSLGIDNRSAHRALGDAMATAELYILLEKGLAALPPRAKEDLLQLAGDEDTPLGELLRRHCRVKASDSVDGGRVGKREATPRRRESGEYSVSKDDIASYISADAEHQQRIEGFEFRPQQLEMSCAVADALNEREYLLVEAGTGTGKSLAYLLPSALFALGSGNQVAISTHTRNLQEQLLNKDIPMLAKLLDRPLRAALLKGRGNYLCKRLYKYLLKEPPENLRYFLMRVAVWSALSATGDGGEMGVNAYERWKWQRLCASRENCAPFCPYSRNGACYVQQARLAAAAADILILNHSLLIANAAIEKGFLPALPFLIVDEAQHLEGAAEDQLSSQIDFYAILNLLARLRRREKGRAAGSIVTLRKRLDDVFLDSQLRETALTVLDGLESSLDNTVELAERFFLLIAEYFKPQLSRADYFPLKQRVLDDYRESEAWQDISERGRELINALTGAHKQCFRLWDLLSGAEEQREEEQPRAADGAEDVYAAGLHCRELAQTLELCLDGDDNYVIWIEFADKDKKPSLNAAPVELNELLNYCLYQNTEALVMTSATLSAGRGGFSFFKKRLGLDLTDKPLTELVLSSPFYYREQALCAIVNDLPDWSNCGDAIAAPQIAQTLLKLLSASQGRAIVLFTSHQQLNNVYQQIKTPLAQRGITVLAHGASGDPSHLLQRLKKERQCCILGANSFWEGVDVLGEALSLIVVVRLPFWPPNSPIAASRMERIEQSGGSSFAEYSLPQALIRFKQGFGRLIRSDKDSGVFCVLDRRIIEKSYGRSFIKSLPDMEVVIGGSDEIAAQIKKRI
ncbi:MAG: helicase C-terminal domain-containing protein [Bacillota bacterium]|nr:helicase C-terminal domain-containing protein [Bacillota bacterium]